MRLPERLSLRVGAPAGAFLFLALFALYVATHGASPYLDDSAETATVAALLGIGHPPGYPFHTLLAHLTCLAPLGSPAEAVNLLAALLAALCATAVFASVLGLASRDSAPLGALAGAALAAVALCLGPIYWHNAVEAKGSIYQLNNLLSVLLLGLACAVSAGAERSRLRLFWLIFGLALAHHYMSQLPLLPAYAWLLWPRRREALKAAWLALPGVALYLYLPLRSAQNPGLNWGEIRTWDDFGFFFFRREYSSSEVTRSAATSLAQAAHALKLCLREGAWVVLPGACAAFWFLKKDRRAQALAAGWLMSLAAVTFYMNLEESRLDIIEPYLFPAYLCQVLLAGWGLTEASRRWNRSLRSGILAAGMAAAVGWGAYEYPAQDLSEYHFALDSCRGLLCSLPKNALLLCQGDAVVFPIWYLQRVLGVRRDVATVGLPVLPMDWVRDDLAREWPDLRQPKVRGPIGAESVPALTRAYLELNPQRPAYASFNEWPSPIPGWSLVSEGPDFRCVPSPSAPPPDEGAAAARLESVALRGFERRPIDAPTRTFIVGDMGVRYNVLGLAAENANRLPEAYAFYRQAALIAPQDPDFAFNTGNALYELGRIEDAAAAYAKAVAIDPNYVNAWYNGGVTLVKLGRIPEAKNWFHKAVELDPSRTDAANALAGLGGS
jgi:tetratricopeptide (TPR) repeat protein